MIKSKKLAGLIFAALLLITAVVIAAAIFVSGRLKEDKYYSQITLAKEYMAEKDYDKVITAYKTAIELKPEEVEAYEALADVYMETGDFKSAAYIAQLGYGRTKSPLLEYLIEDIQKSRIEYRNNQAQNTDLPLEFISDAAASEMTALRFDMVERAADYCFREYKNTYGEAQVRKISDSEGFAARFKGLSADVYFKNSDETPEAVDEIKMAPQNWAKPYKIILDTPSVIFVSYSGYLEKAKLSSMFGTEIVPEYDEKAEKYYACFIYGGCSFTLETDKNGNMTGSRPEIIVSPTELIKEDYEEETETEEETKAPDTFELGGQTFAYDVEEIYIYDIALGDISVLANCKNLKTLYLVNCGITDLSPLAGCESLEKLCLDRNPFTDLSPLAGLTHLKYLQFHESGVTDISPIMGLELEFFNPCSPGISKEQVQAYKDKYPNCVCYYDYYIL